MFIILKLRPPQIGIAHTFWFVLYFFTGLLGIRPCHITPPSMFSTIENTRKKARPCPCVHRLFVCFPLTLLTFHPSSCSPIIPPHASFCVSSLLAYLFYLILLSHLEIEGSLLRLFFFLSIHHTCFVLLPHHLFHLSNSDFFCIIPSKSHPYQTHYCFSFSFLFLINIIPTYFSITLFPFPSPLLFKSHSNIPLHSALVYI